MPSPRGVGQALPQAVQITGAGRRPQRLCRPDLRKACGFPASPAPCPSSALAGRLGLPARAEEVVHARRPSERHSLSASQAAKPQVVIEGTDRNLYKPGATPTMAFLGPQSRTTPSPGPRWLVKAPSRSTLSPKGAEGTFMTSVLHLFGKLALIAPCNHKSQIANHKSV